MDILYIVIPAYNESSNIKSVIDAWYPIVESHNGGGLSRLVFINDGSTDHTYELLQEYEKEKPMLRALTKENGGHGPAVMYGYHYALEQHADYIFQTDSDGQTDPGEFEDFWKVRGEFAAIFGNRTRRGDGMSRAVVEKILCRILKHYFHTSIPDANAPFRLMQAHFLETYLSKLPENYNLPNAVMTAMGGAFHEKIAFKEITFHPRQGGVNSINVKKIFTIGWKAVRDFRQISLNLQGYV